MGIAMPADFMGSHDWAYKVSLKNLDDRHPANVWEFLLNVWLQAHGYQDADDHVNAVVALEYRWWCLTGEEEFELGGKEDE